MQVQLSADAAGWRKKPSNPLLKNFSAFVVKVVHKILRFEEDDNEEVTARVGDGVNSMHNNKLAMLYSGKDSYHMLQKFFTCKQDNNTPSVLEQLHDLEQSGVQLPATDSQPEQRLSIGFLGGGDGKFQSEQAGLNGHSSNYPCGRCECRKDCLHLSKRHLEQRYPNLCKRSLQRCRMLAHKFGAEYGLTEPYQCPGCNAEITEENRHLPQTATAIKEFPQLHFGQYPDLHPLLPVEIWDFIPDLLHALLRTIVNLFFVTVSMNLSSEDSAKKLCSYIQEEIKVEATPVFNQGNREATVKTLQSWNGAECWKILRSIDSILNRLYPEGSGQYLQLKAVWDAWKDLYAVLLIEDVQQDKWNALADVVDNKADLWHRKFLTVTGTQDVTPIMHEIVCHFGDFIRRHGPLGPYSSEGLEARHQPIKRLAKHRTRRAGFGSKGVKASNTDIVQVMRRTCASEYLQGRLPKGKGAKKGSSHSLDDSLSSEIAAMQTPVLVQLGMLADDEA